MPLVPCRVIPHIFFQEVLHELQLIVPQFVLLHSEEDTRWKHACLSNHAVLQVVAMWCMMPNTDHKQQQHQQTTKILRRPCILEEWLDVGRKLEPISTL